MSFIIIFVWLMYPIFSPLICAVISHCPVSLYIIITACYLSLFFCSQSSQIYIQAVYIMYVCMFVCLSVCSVPPSFTLVCFLLCSFQYLPFLRFTSISSCIASYWFISSVLHSTTFYLSGICGHYHQAVVIISLSLLPT